MELLFAIRAVVPVAQRERHIRRQWRRRFTEAAAAQIRANWLGDDGAMIDFDETRIGTHRFLEVAEAKRSFEDRIAREVRCPFLGPVEGFLHVELEGQDYETLGWIVSQLLYISRGFVVCLDDDRRVESTVFEDFALDDLTQKHGFHDGECFYGHQGDHADYVRSTLLAHLDGLGLPVRLITFGTSHNPFRIEEFLPGPHGSPSESERVFERHKDDRLSLWVFNFAFCESQFERWIQPHDFTEDV